MLNRKTKTKLHIRSITDEAGRHDAGHGAGGPIDNEIAELFAQMRQATGLSMEDLADRLSTKVQTLDLLEQGQLSALPEWPEISRVVVEYTRMLGLDSEPVLRRVMVQLPGDHPARPRTQEHDPSYNNMRANADAVMSRVPGDERAVEETSVSIQHQEAFASGGQARQIAPQYGDMRAVAIGSGGYGSKSTRQLVASKRKTSIFVPLVQFLLLLIILATGTLMWLSTNDPQAYEEFKSLALSRWSILREQLRDLFSVLMKQLQSL